MSVVVNGVLSKVFKVFLKDYNKDQLDFNLFSGEATLNKIQLDEQVIHQLLRLPSTIEIKAIKCGLLRIKVPWRNLKHQPLVVHMDHILVDVAETATPLNLPPMSKLTKLLSTIASDTDESLKEEEGGGANATDNNNNSNTAGSLSSSSSSASSSSGPSSSITPDENKKKKAASKDGFIQKLLEEMTINLHDIIARVTFLSSDRTSTGPEILMNLSSLCVQTTNAQWEVVDLAQARVVKKEIKSSFLYKELFLGSLNILVKAPTIGYQEILRSKPLVVKAILKRKFGAQMPYDINVSVHNENIELTVNEKSLPQIVSSVNVILWCLNQSIIESTQKEQEQKQQQKSKQQQQQSDENVKRLLMKKNVFDEKRPPLPPKSNGEEKKDSDPDDKESLTELEKEIEELAAESGLTNTDSDLTYDDFPVIRAACNFAKISVTTENFFVLNIANMNFGGTVEKIDFGEFMLNKPPDDPKRNSGNNGRRSSQKLSLSQPKSTLRSQVTCELSVEDISFTSLISSCSPEREFIRVEQKPLLSVGVKFRNLVRGRQYSEGLHGLELFGEVKPVSIVVEPDFLEKMLDYVGMNFNLRRIIDFSAEPLPPPQQPSSSLQDKAEVAKEGAEGNAIEGEKDNSDNSDDDAGSGGLLKFLNFLENPQISFELKKISLMLGKNMNLSKFLFVEVNQTLFSLERYNHNSIMTYTPIIKEIIHKRQLEASKQEEEEEEEEEKKEKAEKAEETHSANRDERCTPSNILDGSLIFSKISVGIIDEPEASEKVSYIIEPFDVNLDFKVFRPVPLFGSLLGRNSLLGFDHKIFSRDQIPAISADLTVTKVQVSIMQSKIYKIYDDFIFPFLDFVQKAIPVFVKSASQKRTEAKTGELKPQAAKKSSKKGAGAPALTSTTTSSAAAATDKLTSVKKKTAALKKLLEAHVKVAPFPFRVYFSGSLGEINILIGCQDHLTKQIVDSALRISGEPKMKASAMLDLVHTMLALAPGQDGNDEMIHLAGVNFKSTLMSFSYVPSVPPSIGSLIKLTKQQLKDSEAVNIEGRLNVRDFGIYFNPTKYIPVEVFLEPRALALAYSSLRDGVQSEITVKNNILAMYRYEMKKSVPKHNVDLTVSGIKIGVNSSLMTLFKNVQRLLVKESQATPALEPSGSTENEGNSSSDNDAQNENTSPKPQKEGEATVISEEKDRVNDDDDDVKTEGKSEETTTETEEKGSEEGNENAKEHEEAPSTAEATEATNETVKKIVRVGRGVTVNIEICDVEIACKEDSGKDDLGLKGSIKFTPYSNGTIEYVHSQYAQKQEELEEKHNAEVEQLCKKIADARKDFDAIETTLAEANATNASLMAMMDEKDMEIRALRRAKAVQEKQLLQVCEENIGLYKIVHGRVSSSGTQRQFQEIIKSLSTQLLAKDNEIEELKQVAKDLQAQLSKAEAQAQACSIQWDQKFADMEHSYKAEAEALRTKLAEKDAEVARLATVSQENVALTEKMAACEKRIKDLEEELLFSVRQSSAQRMEAIALVAERKSARPAHKQEPLSAAERELMLADSRYKKKPLDLSTVHELFASENPSQQQQQQQQQQSSLPQKPSRLSLSFSGGNNSNGTNGSGAKTLQNQNQSPPPIPQKPPEISKKLTMGLGKFKDKINKGVDMIEQSGKKSFSLFKIPGGENNNGGSGSSSSSSNNNNNSNSSNSDNSNANKSFYV